MALGLRAIGGEAFAVGHGLRRADLVAALDDQLGERLEAHRRLGGCCRHGGLRGQGNARKRRGKAGAGFCGARQGIGALAAGTRERGAGLIDIERGGIAQCRPALDRGQRAFEVGNVGGVAGGQRTGFDPIEPLL